MLDQILPMTGGFWETTATVNIHENINCWYIGGLGPGGLGIQGVSLSNNPFNQGIPEIQTTSLQLVEHRYLNKHIESACN